jgi:hypothetical protein
MPYNLLTKVVVHQSLAEQGVLHRDISFHNVLCEQPHNGFVQNNSGGPEISTERLFINGLL